MAAIVSFPGGNKNENFPKMKKITLLHVYGGWRYALQSNKPSNTNTNNNNNNTVILITRIVIIP